MQLVLPYLVLTCVWAAPYFIMIPVDFSMLLLALGIITVGSVPILYY